MKKIIIILCLLLISSFCFAEKVGEKIYYRNASLGFRNVDTFLTKVEPVIGKEGYYSVDITTVVTPAGSSSAVGIFTFITHYTVKENDKITLYESDYFSTSPITLVVKKVSNNEIQFAKMSDVLNEE